MGRPLKLKRAVVKEELVILTGHHVAALLLNQLLYWTERMDDVDAYLHEEQARQHDTTVTPTEGWIYKSASALIDELMLDLSEVTVRRYLGLLLDRGWIAQRRNPRYPWDRTLQYRVNVVALQASLAELGYALDAYPLLRLEGRDPDEPPELPEARHDRSPASETPARQPHRRTLQVRAATMKEGTFKTKHASFTLKDRGITLKDRGVMMKDRGVTAKVPSSTVMARTAAHEGAIPETLPETTTETPAETPRAGAVVALEALGLSHRQATQAVQRHQLTEPEVACWARWREGLAHVANPVAVLAATIAQQRLPPGNTHAGRPGTTLLLAPTAPAPHAQVWTMVCTSLEHQLGADVATTWFADTQLLTVDENQAVIGAPNVFVRDQLATAYLTPLTETLEAQLGRSVAVEIVIVGSAP